MRKFIRPLCAYTSVVLVLDKGRQKCYINQYAKLATSWYLFPELFSAVSTLFMKTSGSSYTSNQHYACVCPAPKYKFRQPANWNGKFYYVKWLGTMCVQQPYHILVLYKCQN